MASSASGIFADLLFAIKDLNLTGKQAAAPCGLGRGPAAPGGRGLAYACWCSCMKAASKRQVAPACDSCPRPPALPPCR